MEYIILNYSLSLIEEIIIFTFFDKIFHRRFNSVFPTIIAIIAVTSIVYFLSDINIIVKSSLFLLLIITACFVLYKTPMCIRVGFSTVLLYLFYIIDIIVGNAMSLICDKSFWDVYYSDFWLRLIVCYLIKAINLLIIYLLYRTFKKSGIYQEKHAWWLFDIVILVFLYVTIIYMWIFPSVTQQFESTLLYLIVSISFFVMSSIVIYFFAYICRSLYQKQHLMILESSYKTIEEKMAFQSHASEHLQKIRHDLKNHLINAKVLLDNNNAEMAGDLIDDIIGQTNSITLDISNTSSNSLIDAIILYKASECKRKNIRFTYTMEKLPELQLDPVDISSMLSNILDNAIEAASKCTEPSVEISISMQDGYLTIYSCNSHSSEIIENKSTGELISTKLNSNEHGFGTRIIADVAKKYEGDFVKNITDNLFETTVILKNKQLSEQIQQCRLTEREICSSFRF